MTIDRRELLKAGGLTALSSFLSGCSRHERETTRPATVPAAAPEPAADYTIRVGTGLVELAPDHLIATTLYNKQFPGPLIRLREGRPVTVDLHNDTNTPEQLHWHGQNVPIDVDGSAEEGTPYIRRTAIGGSRSRQDRPACASTTHISSPGLICASVSTAARSAPSTSNRRTIPGRTIAKCF